MAVTQRLELRKSQSLVMTPQLQQAIKLLQLSSMDLAAYVERELEHNPLLERDEGTEGEESDRAEADAPAGEAEADPATDEAAVEPPDSLDLTQAESLPADAEAPLDTEFENLYESGPGDAWAGSAGTQRTGKDSGGGFETDERSIDQRFSEPVTLRGHLLEQLQMDIRDPVDRMIGIHLIEMLDEAGYLAGELERLSY